ncbi:unnamed protein product [Caenorhabditis brenneri]
MRIFIAIFSFSIDFFHCLQYCRFIETHKKCIPCGKTARPIDIANIIVFLADRKLSLANRLLSMVDLLL